MYTFFLLSAILMACPCHGQRSSQSVGHPGPSYNSPDGHSNPAEHLFAAVRARAKRSDDIPALQTVVEGLSKQLSEVKAQQTALDNESQQQYAQLKARLDAIQTNNVAFNAHHTTDPFNIAAHGTIVYDAVTTNIGGSYDPQSGIFTAPNPGTYVLFVNCMAMDQPGEELRLVVNGQSTASCYSSKTTGADPYEQGATMATVHLLAGQKALVKSLSGTARDIRGSLWNSFAGFLVHADV